MLPGDVCDPDSTYYAHAQAEDSSWHEINQLKYTCRQLYFETRSFGLDQITGFRFQSFNYPYRKGLYKYRQSNPGRAFVRFLESCDEVYWNAIGTRQSLDIVFSPSLVHFPVTSAGNEDNTNRIRKLHIDNDVMRTSFRVSDAIVSLRSMNRGMEIHFGAAGDFNTMAESEHIEIKYLVVRK